MKLKTKFLLLFVIIISLFLSFTPNIVKGSITDINYTFQNDIAYSNDNNIDWSNSFNLRNKTSNTEIYDASYSFSNESERTYNTDIGFIDALRPNPNITIEVEYLGHDKVINFTAGSVWSGGYNIFSSQTSTSAEFWVNVQQENDRVRFGITEGQSLFTNDGIIMEFYSDSKLYYFQPAQTYIMDYSLNTWYHFQIEFNVANDWHLWINDISMDGGSGYSYGAGNPASLNHFGFVPSLVSSSIMVDAVGYTWLSNYTLGQNIIPTYETDTTIKEVDRYEFGWLAQNQLYAIGRNSEIESWQVDEGGGGTVEVYYDYSQVYTDRTVEIKTTNTDNAQLEKLDIINPISNFVNITFGFNITAYTANGNNFVLQVIDDSTGFAFIEVKIKREVGILNAYYASSGAGNVLIHGGLNIDDYYEVNIFINHEINRANYIFSENGIIIEHIYNTEFKLIVFPYLVSGILFSSIAPAGGNLNVEIDYCGIFDNYESHVPYPNSYGYLTIPLMKKINIQNNNLFTINASGNVSLDIFSGFSPFSPYRTGVNYSVISTFKNYVGDSRLTNAYERTPTYDYSTLVFFFSGNGNNLYNIDIEGNKLTNGVNEYFGQYERGVQTNLDINYFYVDDNNKLQFTLTTSLGSTEYIQATFDIPNLDSTDRAISFRGDIIDKAFGYFYVDYLVGASQFDIPIFEKTTRAILPNNKTIDNFIVLITDNDVDSIIGITTGYVSQPKLLAISSIRLPIITAGLIEMMIPMIMIIVPTLLISKGFGKEGKKLIIPLFFIFSLITAITLIIPIWIFFIIIFGTGLFLARNREMEGN